MINEIINGLLYGDMTNQQAKEATYWHRIGERAVERRAVQQQINDLSKRVAAIESASISK